MKQVKEYKRLPGRYRSSTGQRTLWLGEDHLLAVDRVFFEERYRRFYFSDVQALIIKSTIRWHVNTLILAVLTLVLLTPGWLFWQENDYEIAVFAVIPALLCLFALSVNLIKGKSCRCFLQMRVGIHELPSIRRRRQAVKVLARIKPLVSNAQKGLKVSDLNSSVAIKKSIQKKVEALRSYSGRWHLVLFGVLTMDLLGTVWHFLSPGKALYMVNILLGVAVLFLTIVGLVVQRNTRLPGSVRVATWTILGTYVAFMVAGYFYVFFYFIMNDPSLLANQSKQLNALLSMQLIDHPFLASITAAYVVVGLFCVVFGLMGILRMRRGSNIKGAA